MGFFEFVFQDWNANKGNIKGRIILTLFRIANFCTTRKIYYYIGLPYLIFYRVLVEWFFSIEIPWRVKIGSNLKLYHGQALVLSHDVVIGENCSLRQSTTIGVKQLPGGGFSKSPTIGDFVDIGCNVCIIGDITIGNYAKIGAGAVVVKSVSPHNIVTGNPGVERIPKISTIQHNTSNEQATSAV